MSSRSMEPANDRGGVKAGEAQPSGVVNKIKSKSLFPSSSYSGGAFFEQLPLAAD